MLPRKISLFFILIVILQLKYVQLECSNSNTKSLKTYIIDLDKPARERFYETAVDFQDELRLLIETRMYAILKTQFTNI